MNTLYRKPNLFLRIPKYRPKILPSQARLGLKSKEAAAPEEIHDKKRITILCVDDDPMLRLTETSILKKLGHGVKAANDGADALEIVMQGGISLIVSGYQMPDMRGDELLGAVKKIDPGLPVIIVSATLTPELVIKFKELGASLVMSKPLDMTELKEEVRKILSSDAFLEDTKPENR